VGVAVGYLLPEKACMKLIQDWYGLVAAAAVGVGVVFGVEVAMIVAC